jgi:hypothetical protein
VRRESWSEEEGVSKDAGFTCEFSTEKALHLCGAPARWRFRERVVDDHFCEAHAREHAEDLKSGLMEMLQQAGVSEGESLKPIVADVACDEAGCSARAKYADLAITVIFFCDRHRGYGGRL